MDILLLMNLTFEFYKSITLITTLLISVISFFYIDNQLAILFPENYSSLLLIIFTSIVSICSVYRLSKLAQLGSLLIILFSLLSVLDLNFFIIHKENLSAQLLLSISFLAICILIKFKIKKIKLKSVTTNSVAIIIISIGVAALYGVSSGLEYAYHWHGFAATSIVESIVIILYGLYLFISSFSFISREIRKINTGWDLVVSQSTTNLVLVALIIVFFSNLPYIFKLEQYEKERFTSSSSESFLNYKNFWLETVNEIQELDINNQNITGPAILISGKRNKFNFENIKIDFDIKKQCLLNKESSQSIIKLGQNYYLGFCLKDSTPGNELKLFLYNLDNLSSIFRNKKSNLSFFLLEDYKNFIPIKDKNNFDKIYLNNTSKLSKLIKDKSDGIVYTRKFNQEKLDLIFFKVDQISTANDIYFIAGTSTNKLFKDAFYIVIEFTIIGLGLTLILSIINFVFFRQIADTSKSLGVKVLKQRDEITIALEQKDNLLRELHHRVKNNLQIISSLLRMQSKDEAKKNSQVSEIITSCNNRIKSMALLHEHLYKTSHFESADIKDYLKYLSEQIIRSFDVKKEIKLEVLGLPFQVNIEKSITCGIISNEIITNAIKYAYTDTDLPKFSIQVKQKFNYAIIYYRDNGKGYEEDKIKANKLGLSLIPKLARQIDGRITKLAVSGTCYRLVFKI